MEEEIERIKLNLKSNTIEKMEDFKAIAKYIEQLENKVKEQDKRINGLLKQKQVVTDKLNKTIDKANKIINDQEFKYIEEVIDEEWVRRKLAQELLNLIEGEKAC